MKIQYLLLLINLVLINSLEDNINQDRRTISQMKPPYSGTFDAIWLGGYCYQSNQCDSDILDIWDRESFTIHGLWPSPKAQIQFEDYSLKAINDDNLLDDMYNYWPPSIDAESTFNFWQHEYNKHGKDYSNILLTYQPNCDDSQSYLQQAYFRAGIQFYLSHNLTKLNLTATKEEVKQNKYGDPYMNKKQLSEIIDIDQDDFLVYCRKIQATNQIKSQLTQIKICLRFQQDLQITLEECRTIVALNETKYPMQDQCPDYFVLVGYKHNRAPSTDRVIGWGDEYQL